MLDNDFRPSPNPSPPSSFLAPLRARLESWAASARQRWVATRLSRSVSSAGSFAAGPEAAGLNLMDLAQAVLGRLDAAGDGPVDWFAPAKTNVEDWMGAILLAGRLSFAEQTERSVQIAWRLAMAAADEAPDRAIPQLAPLRGAGFYILGSPSLWLDWTDPQAAWARDDSPWVQALVREEAPFKPETRIRMQNGSVGGNPCFACSCRGSGLLGFVPYGSGYAQRCACAAAPEWKHPVADKFRGMEPYFDLEGKGSGAWILPALSELLAAPPLASSHPRRIAREQWMAKIRGWILQHGLLSRERGQGVFNAEWTLNFCKAAADAAHARGALTQAIFLAELRPDGDASLAREGMRELRASASARASAHAAAFLGGLARDLLLDPAPFLAQLRQLPQSQAPGYHGQPSREDFVVRWHALFERESLFAASRQGAVAEKLAAGGARSETGESGAALGALGPASAGGATGGVSDAAAENNAFSAPAARKPRRL